MDLRKFLFVSLTIMSVSFTGCARLPTYEPSTVDLMPRKGVYHKVKRGETLWRIAQNYQVPLGEIIESNNIPNVAHIEKNQLIFIPGADFVKDVLIEDTQKAGEFAWPLKGKILVYYGDKRRDRISKGIHIQTQAGQTVRAAREGRVVFSDYLSGYAHTVIVDHMDGYFSVYAQNAKRLVDVGEYILKGDPVAEVGGTGRLAYLHFEIRKKGMADNPLYYLP